MKVLIISLSERIAFYMLNRLVDNISTYCSF